MSEDKSPKKAPPTPTRTRGDLANKRPDDIITLSTTVSVNVARSLDKAADVVHDNRATVIRLAVALFVRQYRQSDGSYKIPAEVVALTPHASKAEWLDMIL